MAETKRLIRIMIIDPHPDIPLEKAMLHKGDEMLTDQTDQEIFMELGIKEMLDKHNREVRTATIDKKKSERTNKECMLEPARIRDLRMEIVCITQF